MSDIRQSTQGKFYLTGAFSLAGTSVITGKLLSDKLSGFTITAVSMGILLLCLLPFYGQKTLQTARRLSPRDWLTLCFQAVFGIFLFRMFLLLGIRHTSTAEAGILTGTTPAITAVLAYIFLKERPTLFTVLGIAGTVLGIILLQGNGLSSAEFFLKHMIGNCLVMLAATSESVFNIISRRQKSRENDENRTTIHPMTQTLLVSGITLCLAAVPALLEHPFAGLRTLSITEWLALFWYGLAVTALAFAFFYAGAKRCGAYTIAAFSGVMPLTAMVLSLVFLHETPTAIQWIGSAMILLGMHWIGRKNRRNSCSTSATT